ncbi:TOA1 [Enterospora canceri]|uniref:TOA1 n=1 Tax=Enterospora canceri TaxID=1081671 RepID=A0A1Y1S6Z8_9MICR|nr:TOA1 [Enterospora canceri]
MQVNLNSKKVAYDIINEVCKEIIDDYSVNLIDSNIIYELREDWMNNFESMGLREEIKEDENESIEEEYSVSATDTEEDIDIRRAEESNSYIVCLFVKVSKSKGKWKCLFKDGFANTEGEEDQPFNNASGELEW